MSANDELQAHTCEKMLEFYGDVANNVAQRNSQDYVKKSHNVEENEQKTHKNLTEQWKRGELAEGEYYIKSNKGYIYIDIYAYGSFMFTNYRSIEEVLAPIPSYEKWQSLNEILDSMQDTNKALAHRLNICKKLLKEAKEKFVNLDYAKGLIRRIDEVLK